MKKYTAPSIEIEALEEKTVLNGSAVTVFSYDVAMDMSEE